MSTAVLSSFTIAQSVGRNGVNSRDDVLVVQTLLAEANREPGEATLNPGPVNGTCTQQTIRAIETFQRRFMARVDGRVDPRGRTLQHLRAVTYHDGGVCVSHPQTARALVTLLLTRDGQKYVFGAAVPKRNPNWVGPWDCAEFVAWGIYQVTGRYVGCRVGNAPNGVSYHNSYTGYFAQDLPQVATQISESEAASTIGAIALRSPGNPGHIAVSRGGNRTIEAASTAEGVKSKNLTGRPWTSFWRLNFLMYQPVCSFL